MHVISLSLDAHTPAAAASTLPRGSARVGHTRIWICVIIDRLLDDVTRTAASALAGLRSID